MLLPARQDDRNDVTASDPERRSEECRAEPETHGERVRLGVARAAFMRRLLHEPRVVAALDDLRSTALDIPHDPTDLSVDQAIRAGEAAQAILTLIDVIRTRNVGRMAFLVQELGLIELGPWLPEYLAAAADFSRELSTEDLGLCTIADPRLRSARACLRSWHTRAGGHSSEPDRSPTALLAAAIPANEPADWESRTPDWIELFAMLIEHTAQRPQWTRPAPGIERVWLFQLWPSFASRADPGDDPAVLHGLVALWANTCHGLIEEHTQPSLPPGLVPGESSFDTAGNLVSEGGRDKIRRWVGWYVDREIGHRSLSDILVAAFPDSVDRKQRSSEVKHRIREAAHLLAVELPLDASQPLRLWRLAQEHRDLLEQLLIVSKEHGLWPQEPSPGG